MKYRFYLFALILPYFITLIFTECKFKPTVSVAAPGKTPSPETTTTSHLIFEENFEGKNPFSTARNKETGDWDYALQYVTDPVFQGHQAVRFEIRDDQPLVKNGKRSEVVIVVGGKGDISKNSWYSFAVYFPALEYGYDSEREIISQWYQDGSPATTLRTHKDRLILETGNEKDNRKQTDLGPVIKDKWQEYVLHFIHSHGEDGMIEIWHDGAKILSINGGNMYDDVLPKWKIGLYKAAFKYGTSLVHKRVIFFDNVKVGNSNATFSEMSPNAEVK